MNLFGWLSAVLGLILGGLAVWLWARRRERLRKASMLDAAHRGRALEGQAPAILVRAGYQIVEAQTQQRYDFLVDGEPQRALLRADFLVERLGTRYVVEVKSGEAAKTTRRETRRQLLEYALHFPVQGILLLDVERALLSLVEFPASRAAVPASSPPAPERVPTSYLPILLAFLAGATVVGALCGAMR